MNQQTVIDSYLVFSDYEETLIFPYANGSVTDYAGLWKIKPRNHQEGIDTVKALVLILGERLK